ncbi:hypothetical protein UFOVP142_11 [uncultured Caudovirales phage]|uniref:Uncharacterized protein n=1 Tax=uncultured Caudovirales phage TaxID=2100421 RepID=A0A6J7XKZ4_9CAUD|nr:hypothetical protein UFOVP142_11 [uncultured Caudovirales phage]
MAYHGDMRIKDQLDIFRAAIRNKWDVPAEKKKEIVETLMGFVADESLPAKTRITASKTLADIASQQVQAELAAINVEFRHEEAQRLASYEDTINSDFASIQDAEIVSDTPLHALEDHSSNE